MKKVNIQIPLEEALDRLSIIQIKYNEVKDPKLKERLAGQLLDLEMRIGKAVGYKKYQELMKSKEYSDLYDYNYLLFQGVDRAKRDKTMLAYELDQLNEKRGGAKRQISLRFCGDDSEEIKIRGK